MAIFILLAQNQRAGLIRRDLGKLYLGIKPPL